VFYLFKYSRNIRDCQMLRNVAVLFSFYDYAMKEADTHQAHTFVQGPGHIADVPAGDGVKDE
jgi:hypothetical protein